MEKEATGRIAWVDLVKFFCILFVIVCHLEANTKILDSFFSSFFLMGFLFVSGYCYKNKYSFPEMFKRKTFQLLIPFLIWGAISILFHQLFPSFRTNEHVGPLEEILWFLAQIRGINDGPWFIFLMFVSFIPFHFLVRLYEKTKANKLTLVLIGVSLLVLYFGGEFYEYYVPSFQYGTNALPLHVEYLPKALFFMSFGYFFKDKLESKIDGLNKYLVFLIFFIVYAGLFTIEFLDIAKVNHILNIAFTFFYRMVGVMFLVFLTKIIIPNRFFLYVGKNTLIYFPMHVYLYTLMHFLLHRFLEEPYSFILSNIWISSLFCILVSLLFSLILIIPSYVINRWLPIMSGKFLPRPRDNKNS